MNERAWSELCGRITRCRACPRLVAHREEVARVKRRAYLDQTYWGRPVCGFGDRRAPLVIVGLAPGAHGANRTGRMFTGDRSGDFLYAALYRAGFANQPTSVSRDDGLTLRGAYVVTPVRCAPPQNKPTPLEFATCRHFLEEEVSLLPVRVFLALGAHAWNSTLGLMSTMGHPLPRPRPGFSHGAAWRAPRGPMVLGCYHVSQQNTQTGKLTAAMMDSVLRRARRLLEEGSLTKRV